MVGLTPSSPWPRKFTENHQFSLLPVFECKEQYPSVLHLEEGNQNL